MSKINNEKFIIKKPKQSNSKLKGFIIFKPLFEIWRQDVVVISTLKHSLVVAALSSNIFGLILFAGLGRAVDCCLLSVS